jgi:hypothetical protein
MQTQNSAHLNCGEGWNCCRVHSAEREQRGIHSHCYSARKTQRLFISKRERKKIMTKNARAVQQFAFWICSAVAATEDHYSVSAGERRDVGAAHGKSTPSNHLRFWPRYSVPWGANALAADQHYAFAVNRHRVHLCTMCHFEWRANTGRTPHAALKAIPLLWRSLRRRSNSRT